MALSSANTNDIRRLLECSICLERFNTPRMLPCLHTFCENCLHGYITKNLNGDDHIYEELACPQCSKAFDLPEGGAAGFPLNFFLDHVGDCVPENDDVFCEVCRYKGSSVQATTVCLQCSEHLCERCSSIHCDTKYTRDHHVVSLQEIKDGKHFEKIKDYRQMMCPEHANEIVEQYCLDCKIALCLCCKAISHEDHNVKNIQEVAREAEKNIRGALEVWGEAAEHSKMLSKARKDILDSADGEKSFATKINGVYDQFKEAMNSKVEVQRQATLENLKDQVRRIKKQKEVAYNDAEFNRLTFNGTLEYARNVLKSANDMEIIEKQHDVLKCLQSLDLGKVETKVRDTVISLEPKQLEIPDISMRIVTTDVEGNVESKFTERIGNEVLECTDAEIQIENEEAAEPLLADEPTHVIGPVLKERATRVNGFSSKLKSSGYSSGLTIMKNDIYIPDKYGKHVKIFDKRNLRYVRKREELEKMQSPLNVAVNTDGRLFITDSELRGIVRYSAGSWVTTPGLFKGDGYVTCHGKELIATDTGSQRLLIMDMVCEVQRVISKWAIPP